MQAKNPILPGFYPDPSICRVGEDFYVVNSTFAYFPGLPVFHSRDLCHWEQIGNCMDRKSQLPLAGCTHSQGLYAPTIRFYDGVYYVVCTNVSGGGNFVITAKDPRGPWSEPHYLGKVAPGIDPSLFFEDNKCYYIGTRSKPHGAKYYGDNVIWIQPLDFHSFQLTGEPVFVWNVAMKDAVWPEGPHLYKKDGWYYIVYAEGGTGFHHSVCVIRSREITGPYENHFCNPILTHRFLGKRYPVQYVGHGDMVETRDGEWYMVMLAVRPREGYTHLGRETFLAKVEWEEDWPVVNPGVGILTDTVEVGLAPWKPSEAPPCRSRFYDFHRMAEEGEPLGYEWMTLREPEEGFCRLDRETGGLRLSAGKAALTDCGNVHYLGIRQCHHSFRGILKLDTGSLQEGGRGGFVLLQSNQYHICMEIIKHGGGNGADPGDSLCLKLVQKGRAEVLARRGLEKSQVTLEMLVREERADFYAEGGLLCGDVDIHTLSTEAAGGFTGCTLGMYACGGGEGESFLEISSLLYEGFGGEEECPEDLL